MTREVVAETLQSPTLYHDADGDWHYDVVSALIKSLRGSDPDAALYWLARIPLAQGAVYLATAPKSNASYMAYKEAKKAVLDRGNLPVPLHLRNAPTKLARQMGHGEGYLYPHDHPDGVVNQTYLPDELVGARFFSPGRFGFERDIAKRLQWWQARRKTDPEDEG